MGHRARFDSGQGRGYIGRRYAYRSALHRALSTVTCRPSAVRHELDYEIKHDGYRLMARRDSVGIRLITRRGNDWSDRFPLVIEAVNHLKVPSCLIDGEVVCCDERGLARFDVLRRRRNEANAFLYAFDLLELDGTDLRREPLETRKATLASVLRKTTEACGSTSIGAPMAIFQHACQLGCEGIVSKRLGSSYRSGRSPDWLKFKNPAATAVRREAEEDWGRAGR